MIEWFNMKKLVWLYLRNSFLLTIYSYFEKGCRKKNVHATIPKGNMGYDQYKVPDDCSCRTYFCCFPLTLANTFACGLSYQYFQISLKKKKENSKSPIMPFRIVACAFPDNLSRNSCIYIYFPKP